MGETHEVCPYQLGLDLTEAADLVVGDYNYAFDPERSVVFAQDPGEWVVVTGMRRTSWWSEREDMVRRPSQLLKPWKPLTF